MSFCKSCGVQVATKAAFCSECGAPVEVSENFKQALFLSKQVMWAFLFLLLALNKGSEGIDSVERNLRFDMIILNVVIVIFITVLTYIFLVVKGVKENNPNYVLFTAIFFTVLSVLGFFLDDHSFSNNNFWDWLGFFVGLIQVVVIYRIYFILLKSA